MIPLLNKHLLNNIKLLMILNLLNNIIYDQLLNFNYWL